MSRSQSPLLLDPAPARFRAGLCARWVAWTLETCRERSTSCAASKLVTRRREGLVESGPITALCYLAIIDDPTRFKRSRSVRAYVGLTSRRYASGEVDWTGRISKCGDAMLRSYLYEAAGVLLTRVAKWSVLKAWGMRVAKRSGLRKAKVAVPRKLAVILHRMWVDGTEFKWSAKEVATQPA